jgi:hypothetical protein
VPILDPTSLRALEKLQKAYIESPPELSNQHLGAYIKEIADRLSTDEGLNCRILVCSIMKLVLDQVQDNANLNELDEEGLSPLHVAIDNDLYDGVELLLGKGADPDSRLGNRTPRQHAALCDSYLCRRPFVLRDLIDSWNTPSRCDKDPDYFYFEIRSKIMKNEITAVRVDLNTIVDFGPWRKRDFDLKKSNIWVHVPFISVSTFLSFNCFH